MNWAKVILCVLGCEAAGIIGSIFTAPNIPSWYASLQKPFFSPPNWLFAPAWTLLFLLMGVAFYLILESKAKGPTKNGAKKINSKSKAKGFFLAQLFLNILWSALFFGLRNPLAGFVEIIFLWVFIAITIFEFSKVSKKAAYLMVPYIAWVSFAAMLNYSIWILNAA